MPLLAQYQTLFQRDQRMRPILACMFQSIFEFHLRALRFFKARKWEQFFTAHVFHTEFDDIIDHLRRHKELVERQADLLDFQEAEKARI